MKYVKAGLFVFAVVLAVCLSACNKTEFEKMAYNIDNTAQTTYDLSMTLAAKMADDGTISEEQWATIAKYGGHVQSAGLVATAAMKEYHAVINADTVDATKAEAAFAQARAALLALIESADALIGVANNYGIQVPTAIWPSIPESESQ